MKITVSKIKKELAKQHGWENLEDNKNLVNPLLKDTLSIINEILIYHKNIRIK